MVLRQIKKWLPVGAMLFMGIASQAQQMLENDIFNVYNKGNNPSNIVITNTTIINSESLDFSPTFYQNGIVFTSSRKKNGPEDQYIKETFFDLYFAEFDGSGMPIKAEDFSIEMNSQVHEGPVTFSKDGRIAYFTRSNIRKGISKKGKDTRVHMKVYEAKRGYFDWEEVTSLPFNSDDYTVMHPTLSRDNKMLYFASNMPGGYGGMDLYGVSKDGDIWGKPFNLGPQVNSVANDAFPFIHESGDLFFASKKEGGFGGYDLYKAQDNGETWNKVSNLGKPLNSDLDDLGFIMNPDGTRGYFTSSRSGGRGKDDIYQFEIKEGSVSLPVADLQANIRVYDSENGNGIQDAEIRIFERTADGLIAGGDLYDVMLLPNRSNSNELVLKLVRKDAKSLGDADLTTNRVGESPYFMRPDKQYVLLVSKDGYVSNELIYSTTGKSGDISLEVALGKKRCATVKGNVQDGKTGALLANTKLQLQSSCTSEIQEIRSDAQGQFEYCLPTGCEYTILTRKASYEENRTRIRILTGDLADKTTVVSLKKVEKTVEIIEEPTPYLEKGSVIVLDKIFYDFNKSSIRSGAARDLDALVNVMRKHASLEVELISHTDARGNANYNHDLSERRAASAKNYLVARGIASNRVSTSGKGEAALRNHCKDGVNCNEEEHQYNRRTEVKVTQIDESVRIQYSENRPDEIDRK